MAYHIFVFVWWTSCVALSGAYDTGSHVRINQDTGCNSASADPITCALQNVIIGPLPDICLDIGSTDEDSSVCLQGLTCTDLGLNGFPSAYIAPTAYSLGLAGLHASCSAHWTLGEASGELTALLVDFSSVFGVDFIKEGDDGVLASNVVLNECNVSSFSTDLHFSGRDIAAVKLLNNMADNIEDLLERTIATLLCGPVANELIELMTTLLIERVNPQLVVLMEYGPSEPPVLPDCINWHETPLETIHMLINLLQSRGDSIQQCLATATPTMRSLQGDISLPAVADFLGTSEITVPINSTISLSPNVSLLVQTLSLSGLDSIEDLIILSPIEGSNVTLSSSVLIEQLNVSLSVVLTLGDYTEAATISVSLENSTFLLDLVLGVSRNGLNKLYLDQLTSIGCWQSLIEAISVSSLLVDIDIRQLVYAQISGDAGPLEDDVAAIFQNFIYLLIDGFPELVHQSIIGLGQGPMRAAVNELLSARLDYFNKSAVCMGHLEHDTENPSWIKWNSSVVIKTLDLFLDTVVGADGLNSFFSCATGGTGVVKFTPRPEMVITLSGLTSFYDFNVLLPVVYEPYELYNGIGLGYCPPEEGAMCTPFEIDVKFNVEEDPGEVAVSFQNVHMMLGLFLEVDLNEVYNLQFGDWSSHDGCKMTTVDDVHLYDFQLSSTYTELLLLGDKTRNITALMNKFFAALTSTSSIAKLNSNMNDYLDESDYVCTDTVNPASYDDTDSGVSPKGAWKLWVVIGGACLTAMICIYMHYIWFINDEKSIWRVLVSGNNIFQSCYPHIYQKYGFEEAMIFHPKIPLFWRLAVPVLVVGLMGMIFSSNVSMAVDVLLEIDVGTEVFKLPPIFSYGLGNTIKDMWNAKVYALSALVAFFSGAWPYIKLFAMLLCWVLPPGILSLSRREQSLEWLDILGKWSILDAYVMTLLMVAFHMTVTLEEPIVAIVTVLPKYGFFSFLAATMGSLIIGHVALGVHHSIVGNKRAMDVTSALDWTNAPAMSHEFVVPSRQSKIEITAVGKATVVFLILGTTLLIIAATFMKTFQVQLRGLVGYLIDILEDPNTDYSMLDVGIGLPAASGEPNNIGVLWIQYSFMAFAIVMPLCLQVSLLLLWAFPLSLKWQQRLFVIAEVFNAWSAIDVFAVSIVAVLLEIEDFASFIVGDSCDNLNVLLADYFDEELYGDDVCFDVTATLLPASWTIYAAALLMMTVELPILLLCKRILEERLDLNGVSIFKEIENDTDGEHSLFEPLLHTAKNICGEDQDKQMDGSEHNIVCIGGNSNSNCSEGSGEWEEGGVVVEGDRSDGSYTPRPFNSHHIIEDTDHSSGHVTAHGANRTSGKGGSGSSAGSSGGSRGVLASVDLTDGGLLFQHVEEPPTTPGKGNQNGAKKNGKEASGLSELLGSITPPWKGKKGNSEAALRRSVSTTSSGYGKESFSCRIIDTFLFLRLIKEEPI